jgi:hypothetical protein
LSVLAEKGKIQGESEIFEQGGKVLGQKQGRNDEKD